MVFSNDTDNLERTVVVDDGSAAEAVDGDAIYEVRIATGNVGANVPGKETEFAVDSDARKSNPSDLRSDAELRGWEQLKSAQRQWEERLKKEYDGGVSGGIGEYDPIFKAEGYPLLRAIVDELNRLLARVRIADDVPRSSNPNMGAHRIVHADEPGAESSAGGYSHDVRQQFAVGFGPGHDCVPLANNYSTEFGLPHRWTRHKSLSIGGVNVNKILCPRQFRGFLRTSVY